MSKNKIRLFAVLMLLLPVMLLCSNTVSAAVQDGIADWHTILVNPWNEVPEDYAVSLKTITGRYKVDSRCHADLSEMLSDCRAAGYEPQICSAYRTQAQQSNLYWNKVNSLRNSGYSLASAKVTAAKSVAVPGTSEHQLGLAVDIVDADYPYLNNYQANHDTQKWLMKNCWKYGFILRYPKDKTNITGIIYEPWHYRYVGHTLAKILYDSGLTLEEYLESAPAAPKVTAKNDTETGKIVLTWDAVEDAVKYEIYRATSKYGTYYKMSPTTKTTYTSISITPGKTYYYKVRAVAADGTVSACSDIVSRTCKLARPVVTASTITSTGKIKLTWQPVEGAVQYKITRASSFEGTYYAMSPTTGTSYTSISITPGVTYYYRVTAICENSAGNSVRSRTVARTCKLAQPKVTISNIDSTGKIQLTWPKVTGATQYQVYRATSENGTYYKMTPVSGTTYRSISIETGKKYYYKVQALCSRSAAASAKSEIVSAVCKLPCPTVSIKLHTNGKPQLTWKAIDGAVQYEVYRATSKNGKYYLLNPTSGTSYTNPSAKSGKTYYYKVRAIHSSSAAGSAFSTPVSITSE